MLGWMPGRPARPEPEHLFFFSTRTGTGIRPSCSSFRAAQGEPIDEKSIQRKIYESRFCIATPCWGHAQNMLRSSPNHPKNISELIKNQFKNDPKSTYDDRGWHRLQELQTCQGPRLALIQRGPGCCPERRQPLGFGGGLDAKVEKISAGNSSRARKSNKNSAGVPSRTRKLKKK